MKSDGVLVVTLCVGSSLVFFALLAIFMYWAFRKGKILFWLLALSMSIMYLAVGTIVWMETADDWALWFSLILVVLSSFTIWLMPRMNPSLMKLLNSKGDKLLLEKNETSVLESKGDDKSEPGKPFSAKSYLLNAMIEVFLRMIPAVLGGAIMSLGGPSKIAISFGVFIMSFVILWNVIFNKYANLGAYKRNRIIGDWIGTILIWGFALYILLN